MNARMRTPPTLTRHLAAMLLGCVAASALHAQGSGVRESTDPARAAAVARAASAIAARAPAGGASAVLGPVKGRTAGGIAFLSGGITSTDQVTMYHERWRYSLWVATVARPSGAWLADVVLRVVDLATGKPVLERTMEGPWLFAALPAGQYEVRGSYRAQGAERAQTLVQRVRVQRTPQRQVVLRFDSKADVSPDATTPGPSPFGDPARQR